MLAQHSMTTLGSDRPQRMGLTTISREALYDLVSTEPVRTIAQRMGVSDVWLKKCCSRADIPVPDRGYWAKLRAEKTACYELANSASGPSDLHATARRS